MSKATLRVVQKIGEYQKEDETKNKYQELGVVIESEKGFQSLKLNALPLPDKKGEVWLQLFPINNTKPEASKKS